VVTCLNLSLLVVVEEPRSPANCEGIMISSEDLAMLISGYFTGLALAICYFSSGWKGSYVREVGGGWAAIVLTIVWPVWALWRSGRWLKRVYFPVDRE